MDIQKVGVATPIHATPENKRGRLFEETISSMAKQSIPYSWYIVDDGSSCQYTKELLAELNQETNIFVYPRQKSPNEILSASFGMNIAFQNLLRDSSIGAFCYLHSDDLLPEYSLDSRVKLLNNNYDMAFGSIHILTQQFDYIKHAKITDSTILGRSFPHHTSMWNRKIMEQLFSLRNGKLFDERIASGEDLAVTLLSKKLLESDNYRLGYVSSPVYVYRNHELNISHMITDEELSQSKASLASDYFVDGSSQKSLIQKIWSLVPLSVRKMVPRNVKVKLKNATDSNYLFIRLNDVSSYEKIA